jgi:hypothetical protein
MTEMTEGWITACKGRRSLKAVQFCSANPETGSKIINIG